jgi:hypothetical protein
MNSEIHRRDAARRAATKRIGISTAKSAPDRPWIPAFAGMTDPGAQRPQRKDSS